MVEFRMPSLGADMTEGTLVEWKKKPGDVVKRGDIIADVETDKGTIEVEVFTTGTVDRLLVEPWAKVPVGTPLALIREHAPEPTPATPPPPAVARTRASPLARKIATELGVDLALVQGTGPDGAITRADVERAAPATATALPAAEVPANARMRAAIASSMARSKREIPHFYLATTIDLWASLQWLDTWNAAHSLAERLLPAVLLLRATVRALHEGPELNAHWTGESAPALPDVHLGVAVALRGGGLVAPAIHGADQLQIRDLMTAFTDLVRRARKGQLRASEMSDPTITVTSLGDQWVETVYPVIVPPQVAMVGFGRIVERPWVVDGRVVPRPVVTATLAADHRATDGHRAGLFLAALERELATPPEDR